MLFKMRPGGHVFVGSFGSEEVRNFDHKFEWTRAEFEEWCQFNARRFGYSVSFGGVGNPPEQHLQSIGFCTQYAVFVLSEESSQVIEWELSLGWKEHELVVEVEYPFEVVTKEIAMDKICGQVYSHYRLLQSVGSIDEEEFVPLTTFMATSAMKRLCCSTEEVVEAISRLEYYELNESRDSIRIKFVSSDSEEED